MQTSDNQFCLRFSDKQEDARPVFVSPVVDRPGGGSLRTGHPAAIVRSLNQHPAHSGLFLFCGGVLSKNTSDKQLVYLLLSLKRQQITVLFG